MSDVTRQPGETVPGTDPTPRTRPAPGTRTEGARPEDIRTEGAPGEGAPDLSATATATGTPAAPTGTAVPATGVEDTLVGHDEWDGLARRLHHAVTGFVDAPRGSVEEADRVLEEVTARLTDAVAHRRRALRTSWRGDGADSGAPSTDTEQLRLALRDYRELADRLMRL
ncbi:hypothetical protein [Streptomyces lienomycini]|uniref:Uncharacterized protein n=1 Tax=Streptomyces lienomycini TaxID=284035 RepID=A0ABV9X176_9ACTN|nr:hypothetical protein [Streptomyces lienomycini]